MRKVSYDLSLQLPLELADGTTMSALEMQWEYLDLAKKYAEDRGLESVGGTEIGRDLLRRWEAVLTALETDVLSLAHQIDWVAKYRLIDGYRERHSLGWRDPKLAALDLQYHDVRPEKSLADRAGLDRLFTDAEVEEATTEPPRDTRAYFRGQCLKRWASSIAAANWDSLVFDLGTDPLRRVPMMEPLRGTALHVDSLFEGCSSPAQLLERLGT
jgi:proteasome accessory factor A